MRKCPACHKKLVLLENFYIICSNSDGTRYVIACENCGTLMVEKKGDE